jgi:hypothetical protein
MTKELYAPYWHGRGAIGLDFVGLPRGISNGWRKRSLSIVRVGSSEARKVSASVRSNWGLSAR